MIAGGGRGMYLVFGILLVGLSAFFLGRALAGYRHGVVTLSLPGFRLTATRARDPRRFPLAIAGNVVKALVAAGAAIWLVFLAD
jgi:hypothetical protein